MSSSSLSRFVDLLRSKGDLLEVTEVVDPHLEIAEIHRRIILQQGPALLFKNPKGSPFPVVTNLFGTKERVELAFGPEPKELIEQVAALPQELMPPSVVQLWQKRGLFKRLLKVGLSYTKKLGSAWKVTSDVDLEKLPLLTTWPEDGGAFVTLPLVYTEHPESKIHNLGMYRLQRYSKSTTGLHMQIGKGGGFHLAAAKEAGQTLPVNVFIGGPPAAILAAIAPLPENVPELLLASLVLNEKLRLVKNDLFSLPALADAEFILSGYCDPTEQAPEGPFGDHYGYYSLTHDFPVFHCTKIASRSDSIYPATVVGKPRQEDYYIGNYLQDLLSPLFPLVMPAVKDLWSYGETGYHSLAAAVVRERYKREALVSGFRILGEGQLSLTKFLLLLDQSIDLKDFRSVLAYVLERADFRTDLYIFSNTSMDTLDYTGPSLNQGSKGILLGIGDPVRSLPHATPKTKPEYISEMALFCPGCLVVSGQNYTTSPTLAERIASDELFSAWPLVILTDDVRETVKSDEAFLWTTFTRFEPASNIFAKNVELHRYHPQLEPPLVIDARMKPSYPPEVFCDDATAELVDKRWEKYFS